jgi:hypothetical protein
VAHTHIENPPHQLRPDSDGASSAAQDAAPRQIK